MNDGGPAFPTTRLDIARMKDQGGMSLRDYFAGQALAGLLSCDSRGEPDRIEIATYRYADAMLVEREKPTQP